MNDDQIDDLKQFITSVISGQTLSLRSDLRNDLKTDLHGELQAVRRDIKKIESKIDNLSDSVAQALDTSNDAVDAQLQDHEARLTNLEHQTA